MKIDPNKPASEVFQEMVDRVPKNIRYYSRTKIQLWNTIRRVLDQKGWTLEDLSEKSGIPLEDVDKLTYIGGDPDLKHLCDLGYALGLELRFIYE